MDFKRKIYAELLEWKSERKNKAIVIEGLRQIGKSYIVDKFARENYRNVYSFDFRKNESHRLAFRKDFKLKDFKEDLFILFEREFDDRDAVLVFDEIGDCPDARAAVKYILKETNFDIIATGSLLGVKGFKNRGDRSPSVGFDHYIEMHPLDFEEFLWANGIDESTIASIKESLKSFTPMDELRHRKFSELFRHYMICGGMPEAVIEYIGSHDFAKVIGTNIDKLKDLQGDFGKIVTPEGKLDVDEKLLSRTNEIYSSITSQLAKDNAKFQYSFLRKGARAKEYEEAIVWLDNSGMISRCYNLTDLALPLAGYSNSESFKIYFSDIGLYIAKMGFDTASLLLSGDLDSYGGYIYEGVAADILTKADFPLYYSDNGKSEVDFVIQEDNKTTILEVKMAKGNSKSAKAIIEGKANRKAEKCYKITGKNFSKGTYYYGLPHYALPFLLSSIRENTKASLKVEPISF